MHNMACCVRTPLLHRCMLLPFTPASSTRLFSNASTAALDEVENPQDAGEAPIRLGTHRLPPVLVARLRHELRAHNLRTAAIKADAKTIITRFGHMALPVEATELERLGDQFSETFQARAESKGRRVSDAELEKRVRHRLRLLAGRHKPLAYTSLHACAAYAFARAPAEYAAARRVLAEVVRQDAGVDWSPSSALDFGSGLGTLYWAVADMWPQKSPVGDVAALSDRRLDAMAHEQSPRGPSQYVMVDRSADMLALSRLLIQGRHKVPADQQDPLMQRTTIVRDPHLSFDLVMSAYTLVDVDSFDERAQLIDTLWQLTNKYLLLIERGSYSGFRTIIEARDRVIAASAGATAVSPGHAHLDEHLQAPVAGRPAVGHVVAPCAHQLRCPRTAGPSWRPCHFHVHYERPQGMRLGHADKEPVQKELFSYVVLKKGERTEPYRARALTDPYRRHGKSISLQVCAPDGTLKVCRFRRSTHSAEERVRLRRTAAGDTLLVPHVMLEQ